jgi:hypothetical protein
MELRAVPEGKVVLKDTHTMYVVDNNGLVSEIAESAQAKIRGIKFCGQREYDGPHKKEVAAMKGKPLIFMTMQEVFNAVCSKNIATLDEKPKYKKTLPRGLKIMFELFVIAKK